MQSSKAFYAFWKLIYIFITAISLESYRHFPLKMD